MKKIIVAVAMLILIAPSAVLAQEIKGYVGLGVGQGTADIDATPIPGAVATTVDDSDTSIKIFGGVLFNPHFGLEFAYADFGELSKNDRNIFGQFINQAFEASAFSIAAVGYLPLSDVFDIYGKAGFALWDADGTLTSNIPGIFGSASESGTDFMFGIGLQYTINAILLRAEFERYTDIGGDDLGGTSDIDVLGLAVGYAF